MVRSEQELLDFIYDIHPFDDEGMYKEGAEHNENITILLENTGLD